MKKLYIFSAVTALLILSAFVALQFFKATTLISPKKKHQLYEAIPDQILIPVKILADGNAVELFKLGYNYQTLTDVGNRNFEVKSLALPNIDVQVFRTFFIEYRSSKIIYADYKGNFYTLNIEDFFSNAYSAEPIKLDSNISPYEVLDILVERDQIFISFVSNADKCGKLNVASATLGGTELIFESIFTSEGCTQNEGEEIQGGRMQSYVFQGKQGILLTASDNFYDYPTLQAQNPDSIFGKVLFLEIGQQNVDVLSIGHRNAQGLVVSSSGDIIATEHGPRGGDEINMIQLGGNYGWPVASYGVNYGINEATKYLAEHSKNGFIEPIFTFLPSIGIGQIVQIPSDFSSDWENDYFIASLNANSLYRTRISTTNKSVLFMEKLFVGERIRDIVYVPPLRAYALALEDSATVLMFRER